MRSPRSRDARSSRRALRSSAQSRVAGQEQLPELLGLDRIADVRIERMPGKVIFGEDRRQQEWADCAPSLVDIDRGLRCRDQLGESRARRRQPQHRIVDEARPDSVGLAAEHEAVVPKGGLAQAEHVGVDPAAARLPHHPVAKHVGEGGERRFAVGDESAESAIRQGKWCARPRGAPREAGRAADHS